MVQTINQNQMHGTLATYQSASIDISRVATTSIDGTKASTTDTLNLRRESTAAVTYTQSMQLTAADESRYGMLRDLVANLLQEQGVNTKIAVGNSEIDIAAVTPEEAQELISEDGYFGVKQTSERIFQFAIGVAGGDATRIDAIKQGIDKGFAEAKKAFGDWLPDISYETYDAVMQKLDDWAAESKAVA
ncbi:hypothetical protein Despr_2251 [Desulfobulbus propionicus DSM 2032]|jgi:hypothetical protein|uniref:DUF5610 domain-containing protein n=1 Tax=Desulfobulbus propionicus (strain ATCC 33891 / DSM 2032 / VKM B-1956 / 1pr3) TaxID=577650 RepID=A0A7U3YN21_DESPD|nr:hypothetical protein [Desulfobulbus propionicus]ADW18395.1 hypothetical protein Despr_2251 [Desulfobulbus propionicus DSM 2032]